MIMADIQAYAEQPQTEYKFNPNEHLMQIKNKGGASDYLPVQWRLVWFRSLCPGGTIETEIVMLDLDRETEEEAYAWNNDTRRSEKIIKRAPGIAIFRATVKDGKGGIAIGTKSEKAASFPDFIEKAETGAIGRALAGLGYGTQFAPELDEQHRIVDAPVEQRQQPAQPQRSQQRPQPTEAEQEAYKKRRQVVEADPEKPAQEGQSEAVKQMIHKASERAKGIGITTKEAWSAFILDTLKEQKPTHQWTLNDVSRINGELTRRERQPANV
jgi:hypothetical protein